MTVFGILRNLGDGTFDSSIDYAVGDWPYSVALGDVDNDGDLDALVTNRFSNSLWVLKNQGDGSFAPQENDYAIGNRASDLVMGDVDSDGDLDVVVAGCDASKGDGGISMLRNQGDGTFAPPVSVADSDWISSVALGDIDGDGDLDVVDCNHNTHCSALENQGDGTFIARDVRLAQTQPAVTPSGLPPINPPPSYAPAFTALGDIDGDGDLDAVVTLGLEALLTFQNYSLMELQPIAQTESTYIGQNPLTYTIHVANHSVITAKDVWVSTTLPSGIVYVPGSISGPGADDSQAPFLQWHVGDVSTSTKTFTLNFQATAGALDHKERVTHTLSVMCDECHEVTAQYPLIADFEPPSEPTLLSPPSSAYTNTRRLIWSPVTDTVSGLGGYVAYMQGPSGTYSFTTTDTFLEFGPAHDIDMPDGVYTWWVQAFDRVYNYSEYAN